MTEPCWLHREDCVTIHEMMLSQYGGLAGIRDEGMLASALGKARNHYVYEHPSLPQMAASYAAGIIQNHPFIDGNKRTGFMLAALFLEINGMEFFADEVSVAERTLALAAGYITEADYAAWLTTHSRPTPPTVS